MTLQGTFRKDLYYRLSVIKIMIPSLNERREDIPQLIRHFLININEKYDLHKELTFEAVEHLKNLPYQGNVRNLQNVIEQIVLLSQKDVIDAHDVETALNMDYGYCEQDRHHSDDASDTSLKSLVARYEKELLEKYYAEYKSASKIAEILHTTQPTISRKLHAYGISVNP